MSDDTSEPAIPVVRPTPTRGTAPLQSIIELLQTAQRDWPQASAPGVNVGFVMDKVGVGVSVTFHVHDEIDARVLASRTYDGDWQISGGLRWTMRQ